MEMMGFETRPGRAQLAPKLADGATRVVLNGAMVGIIYLERPGVTEALEITKTDGLAKMVDPGDMILVNRFHVGAVLWVLVGVVAVLAFLTKKYLALRKSHQKLLDEHNFRGGSVRNMMQQCFPLSGHWTPTGARMHFRANCQSVSTANIPNEMQVCLHCRRRVEDLMWKALHSETNEGVDRVMQTRYTARQNDG